MPVVYVLNPDGSLQGVKLTGDALELLVGNVVQRGEGLQPDEYGYASAYLASEWAFRCLNVRAAKTAELLGELQVVERDTGKAWPEHPFLQAVERAYARYHQDYYFQYVIQLDMFGEQYTEKIAGTSPYLGQVRIPWGIRVLPSLAVEPEIVSGEIRRFIYYGEDRVAYFAPDQVAYDYTFNPFNTLRGVSLLAGALNAVNLDLYVVRHNLAYFQNGVRPALVISPKPGETFAEDTFEVIKAWLEKNKGVASFFKTLPLTFPVDVQQIQYPTLEDQQYLTEDQRERICAKTGVPVGLVSFSNQRYQLSPEQRIAFNGNTTIPLAKRVVRFLGVNVLPFFDPDGRFELRLDEAKLSGLVEDEVQKDQIVQARFESGRITFNQMLQAQHLPPVADGDFYMLPQGKLFVRSDKLGDLVEQAQSQPVIPPLSLQLGEAAIPPRPALPVVRPQTLALPERTPSFRRSANRIRDTKSSYGVPDGTVVLYLTDVEDLLVDQQVLMRSLPADAPIRWTPIEQLHVTLIHAPLVDEPEFRGIFQETVPFPGFALRVTQVTTFESDGPVPIVALVEPTDELKAFQSGLYDSFALRGVAVSEYSLPGNWTPHITLGYADGLWAAGQNFDMPGDVTCRAISLAFTRGDYETIDLEVATQGPYAQPEPTEAGRELRAWRRATLRKGRDKALAFECAILPAPVRDAIRMHLAVLPDDRDTQAEIFRAAEHWLAYEQGDPDVYTDPAGWKAIQATRLEFENAFEDVLREARQGNLDRRRWAGIVRSLLRRWGIQAFRDGLVDGGYDPGDEPLDPEDQAELNRLLAEQNQYVTAFGEALFAEEVTDPQAENKPAMWFNKSILPLYQAGRLSADRNGLYEWLLGRTEEHCRSCLAAVGQRHRLKDWYRAGVIPQADLLECRGFNCDCKFQKTSGRAKGRLDRIPLGEAGKQVHLDSVLLAAGVV